MNRLQIREDDLTGRKIADLMREQLITFFQESHQSS